LTYSIAADGEFSLGPAVGAVRAAYQRKFNWLPWLWLIFTVLSQKTKGQPSGGRSAGLRQSG